MKVEQYQTFSQQKQQPLTTDHQSVRIESENLADLQNQHLEHYSQISTNLNQNALEDINLRSVYVLDKNLLLGTKITPNIRARIRGFVMDECSKQWMTRDTCALACTYCDLYLMRKGYCKVQEVQTMAIACLILARKIQEGKSPTISFNVFSKEILLEWQKKIVKTLQYQLSPPTYFNYAQHVTVKWDLFTSKSCSQNKKVGECKSGANLILRQFYQQLDCLFLRINCFYLVTQTFKWDLQLVALNMFYLQVFLLHASNSLSSHKLSNQDFLNLFYCQKSKFKIDFQNFLMFYSKEKSFKLQPELGLYLKLFLGLKTSKHQFIFLNNSKFNCLREWDKLQTYSKQTYEFAKAVMGKIKKK